MLPAEEVNGKATKPKKRPAKALVEVVAASEEEGDEDEDEDEDESIAPQQSNKLSSKAKAAKAAAPKPKPSKIKKAAAAPEYEVVVDVPKVSSKEKNLAAKLSLVSSLLCLAIQTRIFMLIIMWCSDANCPRAGSGGVYRTERAASHSTRGV